MACTQKEWEELVKQETYVDMEKLRDSARYGIAEKVRGEVWKYLLGVTKPDKSEEMTELRKMMDDYTQNSHKNNNDLAKRVRGEIHRYKSHNTNFKTITDNRFENILLVYINNNKEVEYTPGMVHLLAPFVFTISSESDIYYCYLAFMKRMEDRMRHEYIEKEVANLMMIFQSTQPELYNLFEEEEVTQNELREIYISWLQYLLSRELPLDCVLRLWDTYFAIDSEKFELHMYVCLAILENCHEHLLEMSDSSEIKGFLQHLPKMDMDKILTQATNIREEVRLRNIIS